ncbi:MAG TPA: sodium-dependent transporter [Planctomycetota bacterium]|nr:sodium-dependent transporter [Planctomycetota bacterium]
MTDAPQDKWTSKLGIILAVAGSAVGLGNFLRFPVQAVRNGGGAFMIPYLVALVLLGIPLMWIEWTVGRYGGAFGHSTAPGMFHRLWRNRYIKYFGLIGIFGPIVIFIFYTYVESWTLAYAFFSLSGKYAGAADQKAMAGFLKSYQGLDPAGPFRGLGTAYIFFLLTFAANCWIVFRGISKGIEWLCKWAMPALLVIAVALAVRVLSLGAPVNPAWTPLGGLGYMWNPDFEALKNPDVWLAAAGQIFFTLSVGIGVILTYASYLSRRDDVALSGLTAAGTNELAEVVLGGTIIIPAAFVFFGQPEMEAIAKGASFDLGFVTMPLIFTRVPAGAVFGCLWFLLLFLAGMTSSISLAQPAVAFLTDELGITKRKAAIVFVVICFVLCQPTIFFLGHGVLDELDFWGGTFCLVLFATIETILFGWFFGIDKAWSELHYGADIRIPRFYRYTIKYVTPLFLLAVLGTWLYQKGIDKILMKDIAAADRPYVLGARLMLVLLLVGLAVALKIAWNRRRDVWDRTEAEP